MPKFDWTPYFPYEEIRPGQKDAIEAIIDSFESGVKYFILEAGTGVGKCAIGITISRYISAHIQKSADAVPGSYVLTTQKILQEQYNQAMSDIQGIIIEYGSNGDNIFEWNVQLEERSIREFEQNLKMEFTHNYNLEPPKLTLNGRYCTDFDKRKIQNL